MSNTEKLQWLSRRDDFPWLAERDQLIALLQEKKKRGEIEVDQYGQRKIEHKTPLGEVLRFARVARRQPEIWEAIQGIASRYRADPHTETTKDEAHFFSFFREWYVLKNNLPYAPSTFIGVDGLLLRIAQGVIEDDLESPRVAEALLELPWVIDNSGKNGVGHAG